LEEGGKRFIPTCHGCGKKCEGGWRKCRNITEEHRAKVAELDTAGHFKKKPSKPSNNNNKTGTVNVAAGEDDDADDGGDDDANKTTTSSLTGDPIPSYGDLLRITGHISTNVGMREEDGVIYEEEGSWDGDVLANIGVGFIQVQGEGQNKTSSFNKE